MTPEKLQEWIESINVEQKISYINELKLEARIIRLEERMDRYDEIQYDPTDP